MMGLDEVVIITLHTLLRATNRVPWDLANYCNKIKSNEANRTPQYAVGHVAHAIICRPLSARLASS